MSYYTPFIEAWLDIHHLRPCNVGVMSNNSHERIDSKEHTEIVIAQGLLAALARGAQNLLTPGASISREKDGIRVTVTVEKIPKVPKKNDH